MGSRQGDTRITLNAEDSKLLHDLVQETGSSRTRMIRLALKLYKGLRDREGAYFHSATEDLVVSEDQALVDRIIMPWDEEWDGLSESVEDNELSPWGQTATDRGVGRVEQKDKS